MEPATDPPPGSKPGLSHEWSWDLLARELKTLNQSGEPLRADWYGNEGSEDYGIWHLLPDGPDSEEVRAGFSLNAARAIAKLGLLPIPVPEALQHDPQWTLYCKVEEEIARCSGRMLDMSDAVPYGLGNVDRDAVDPCTRAWLELLRRESPAFRIAATGWTALKGKQYNSSHGTIPDVCAASAVYCTRRARDEIGRLLTTRLGQGEGSAADASSNAPDSPVLKTPKKRGRRPDRERRDGIRNAISNHNEQWRDHLSEIFTELDNQGVRLGDFENIKIDLGDGQRSSVLRWGDLDLAQGEQRRQIVDSLRKHADRGT